MSVLSDDIASSATTTLNAAWNIRDGQVVPATDDVTLKNGAVHVDATYLYADMAGSSTLAQMTKHEVTAKIIRSYINSASRILRHYDGAIRSFDGDRVMAVFIGGSKNSNAARSAFALNWAVKEVLRPKIKAKWPNIAHDWTLHHGVGIATGQALIVRGGVRNNNDLISIGEAPNIAAKLSEFRKTSDLYITSSVHNKMADYVKYSKKEHRNMWSPLTSTTVGGRTVKMYGSAWLWSP